MFKISKKLIKRLFLFVLSLNLINSSTGQQVRYEVKYNPSTCLYEAHAHIINGSLSYPNTVPFPSKFSIVVPASVNDVTFNVVQSVNPSGLNWANTNNIYAPASSPANDFHAFTISGGSGANAYTNFTNGNDLLLFTFSVSHTGCNDGIRCYINGSDPGSNAPGMLGIDFSQSFKTFPNVDRFNGITGYPVQLPRPAVISYYTANCSNLNTFTLKSNASSGLNCGNLSYSWTGYNGFTSALQNPVVNSTVSPATYSVKVTDYNGCTATSTVNYIQPNPILSSGSLTGPSAVCQNQSNVVYTVSPIPNASSYIWTLPDNSYDTTQVNSISVNFQNITTSGNLKVKGHNICSEGSSATLAVTINPSPTVNAGSDTTVCLGDSLSLNASGGNNIQWNNNINQNTPFLPESTNLYIAQGFNQYNCSDIDTVLVTVKSKLLIVKAMLEGLYNSNSIMNNALNDIGIAPWGNSIADKVEIEIRNSLYPYTLIETQNVNLSINGEIKSPVHCSYDDSYYIVVKHRNHIETWSSSPVPFSGDTVSYDFTNSIAKAYGNNMILLSTGIYGILAGDVNQDGLVDGSDMSDTETDNNNFSTGYIATDVNGDGLVDGSDMSMVETANNNFSGVITP